jgi:hypothetical protein
MLRKALTRRSEGRRSRHEELVHYIFAKFLWVYNELNKMVKRSVPRDWSQYLDGLAEEAQSGKVLTNIEEQSRRWREHFEEVLNQPSEPTEDPDDNETPPLRIRTDSPSKAEIVQAPKEMKSNLEQREKSEYRLY